MLMIRERYMCYNKSESEDNKWTHKNKNKGKDEVE